LLKMLSAFLTTLGGRVIAYTSAIPALAGSYCQGIWLYPCCGKHPATLSNPFLVLYHYYFRSFVYSNKICTFI
jgi:hypothetical protein